MTTSLVQVTQDLAAEPTAPNQAPAYLDLGLDCRVCLALDSLGENGQMVSVTFHAIFQRSNLAWFAAAIGDCPQHTFCPVI